MRTQVRRGLLWRARVGGAAAVAAVALAVTGTSMAAQADVTPAPTTPGGAETSLPAPTETIDPDETPTPDETLTPDETTAPDETPPGVQSEPPSPPARPVPSRPITLPATDPAVLGLGMTSSHVAELQRLLDANSTRDYFGDSAAGPYSTLLLADTESALKSWQTANGFSPSGVVITGSAQWQRLQRDATASRTSVTGPTLARGTTHAQVRTLQAALHNDARGSRSTLFTSGVYDTFFGPEVEAALRRWQVATGFASTGSVQVGSTQWGRLLASQKPFSVGLRSPAQLRPGTNAAPVRTLQSMLDRNNLQDYQPYTNGVYDTFLGPSTVTGLKQLQSRLGYTADGIIEVGSLEWGHLASLATVSKSGKVGANLRYGTVHSAVTVLQQLLDQNSQRDYYIPGSAGGYTTSYLSTTVNALRAWQAANGYPTTGVITVNTIQWGHLVSQRRPAPRLDPRCYTNGVVLCASKSLRKTFYVNKGVIIKELDARFGGLAYSTTGVLRNYTTREGTFTITRKIRDEVSYAYNNTPMPFSMYFYGGQAFHYSYGFAANGYSGNMGSHGCINLRDWNGAQWLYNNTPVGTKVVVYP